VPEGAVYREGRANAVRGRRGAVFIWSNIWRAPGRPNRAKMRAGPIRPVGLRNPLGLPANSGVLSTGAGDGNISTPNGL
jgi:hypothetical protein